MVPREGGGGVRAAPAGDGGEAGGWRRRGSGGAGRGVEVETTAGVIRAGAVIVTVSTGVLAGLRFEPALPDAVSAAVHALPMGLLTKVALVAPPGSGRLGVEPGTVLVDRDGGMTFNAWPLGRGYVAGFVGGGRAWALAGDARAAEAFALEELRRMLGAEAVWGMRAAVVTGWGTDPTSLGAYAYAGPGDAGARGVLADAYPGERVVFAGEAYRTDGLAGTVGGAFLSGVGAGGAGC